MSYIYVLLLKTKYVAVPNKVKKIMSILLLKQHIPEDVHLIQLTFNRTRKKSHESTKNCDEGIVKR